MDPSRRESGVEDRTVELVRRAIDGDDEAVGDLYRLYEGRLESAVHALLGKKLRSRVETVDLIQSVWKDVLPDIARFEYRGPDSFLHWLSCRVATKIHDKAKYHGAEKRDPARERPFAGSESGRGGVPAPAASEPTPSEEAIADEESERLLGAVETLPLPLRQIVVLRTWDGLAFKEIGRILGEPPDTVRKRYERGMKRLRRFLESPPEGRNRTRQAGKRPSGTAPA